MNVENLVPKGRETPIEIEKKSLDNHLDNSSHTQAGLRVGCGDTSTSNSSAILFHDNTFDMNVTTDIILSSPKSNRK